MVALYIGCKIKSRSMNSRLHFMEGDAIDVPLANANGVGLGTRGRGVPLWQSVPSSPTKKPPEGGLVSSVESIALEV